MKYPAQIVKITHALWDILPSADVRVVGYVDVGRADPVLRNSDFIDPDVGDIGQLEGKVVADYQPRVRLQDGRVGSAVDVWIGDMEERVLRKEWVSEEFFGLGD